MEVGTYTACVCKKCGATGAEHFSLSRIKRRDWRCATCYPQTRLTTTGRCFFTGLITDTVAVDVVSEDEQTVHSVQSAVHIRSGRVKVPVGPLVFQHLQRPPNEWFDWLVIDQPDLDDGDAVYTFKMLHLHMFMHVFQCRSLDKCAAAIARAQTRAPRPVDDYSPDDGSQ